MSISKRLIERTWTRLDLVEVGDLLGHCGVCKRDEAPLTFVIEDGMAQVYLACHDCAVEYGMVCEVCGERMHDGLVVWLFGEDRSGLACGPCEKAFTS